MTRFFTGVGAAIADVADAIADNVGPREIALLCGLNLVAWGAHLVWVPLGFLLPGAVLLYVSIFGTKV